MKKIFFIIISAIILGFLFFGIFQHFLSSRSQMGALQVTSEPESQVYINDELVGKTPLCKCETGDTLEAGEYSIKLVPKDDDQTYQEKIKISEGVLTVVDRKFSSSSQSSGSVITLTPLNDKKAAELLVVSIPSNAVIHLDNDKIGNTPYLYDSPTISDHSLRVTKEGYEEKTVRIRTPQGYKLTVAIYLGTEDNSQESTLTLSPIPTNSPSTENKEDIIILDTPTGFLRVRSEASITSKEIARIKPGEKFELVEEQVGWYQIKLSEGSNGWISSQYASRQ